MTTSLLVQVFLESPSRTCTRAYLYVCVTHPQKLLPTRIIASTREFVCEYSRVLASSISIASTLVFVCKYSRVFSSLVLASFNSRVGNALLACSHSHLHLELACSIASDMSHSHACVYTKFSVEA